MSDDRSRGVAYRVVSGTARFALGVLASLVARLVPVAVVVLCLVAFGAIIVVLAPVLSPLGVSDQAIAAVAGAGVLVGFWAVGLKLLIDR